MKATITLILSMVSALAQPSSVSNDPASNSIPATVQRLLVWPSPATISEKQISPTTDAAKTAVFNAERWLRQVIDSELIPAQLEPICTEGEFEGRDVIRYRWDAAGKKLMVAQTGSIFVLEIEPVTGKISGDALSERLDGVRELCGETFAKTGVWRGGQGEKNLITRLNEKLLANFFIAAATHQSETNRAVLFGHPKGPEAMDSTSHERNVSAGGDASWFGPHNETSSYWFRNIHWFSDRGRVVVYFLKQEGGPVVLNFAGSADASWF